MKLSLFLLALILSVAIAEQPEGYIKVEIDDYYSDSVLQNLVDFGAQHIINTGIANGNLPDTEYYITQIYSIAKKELVDKEDVNYAFDVMIMDHDGTAVRSNYIVVYNKKTQAQEVLTYTYDEEYYLFDTEIQESDSSDDDEPSLEEIAVEPSLIVSEGAEWLGDVWFTEDELIDEKGLMITGATSSVSLGKFNSDPELQDLFLLGLEEVLEQIAPQEIAVTQFHVNNIFEVSKQVVNGISYIFDAEVESSQGVIIRTKFEVYSQSWTGAVEVLSYSYTLTDVDGSTHLGEENFIDF